MTVEEFNKLSELRFYSNDLNDNVSIKTYIKEILKVLWLEPDDFNGKRPLGNSGWQFDLYKAMIEKNIIEGEVDDYGCVDSVNMTDADKLIIDYISILLGEE